MVCMLLSYALPNPDEVELHPQEYSWIVKNWWRFIFGFPMLLGFVLFILLWMVFTIETPLYYSSLQSRKAV